MSFSEIIEQTSHVGVYYPGNSTCQSNCNSTTPVQRCNGCDWQFSTQECQSGCPSQPVCSKIDTSICPIIGDSVKSEWATTGGFCPSKPLVECNYNASTFSYNDIIEYKRLFCTNDKCQDNKNYNEIIAPTFCYQQTGDCPTNPSTGNKWPECPNILMPIIDKENSGKECQNWSTNNPSISDQTMMNYCSTRLSDPICNCINKDNSAVYNYINNGMQLSGNYSPACWYSPCFNSGNYLVPSNLNNVECPSQVCTRVNEIIRTIPTNLTVEELQNELSCEVTVTPIPINQNNSITTNNNSSSSSTSDNSSIWIIIVIVLIIIIIVLIMLYVIYNSKK